MSVGNLYNVSIVQISAALATRVELARSREAGKTNLQKSERERESESSEMTLHSLPTPGLNSGQPQC